MKSKLSNRIPMALLSLVLIACVMVVSLLPGTVLAAEMEDSVASLTVNSSKVAFAGHEWWVIGDGSSGVYSQAGHITLLAVNSEFGTTAFRTGSDSSFEDSTQHVGDGYFDGDNRYYANNPGGMNQWTTSNEYAGSTLQRYMVSIASSFPAKEQNVITARNLASNATDSNNWSSGKDDYMDGIAGQGIANQKLWAISEAEWNTINDNTVLSYGDVWWLRSPALTFGSAARGGNASEITKTNYGVSVEGAARPALSLNLSSVLFTSAASETSGKSAASVGSSLASITEISTSSTVKFTMKDSSQTLTVNATDFQSEQTGETLYFTYSNAATGTNQYVSCVLIDSSGDVVYYGKLVDCEEEAAASGELSIPLEGVANGIYTLQIFSEEANGYLYTDFCSEPIEMTVTVSGGSGTVSNYAGVVSGHSWYTEWSGDETHHWHDCMLDSCTITDNSQKDGYAAHTYNQQVVSADYLVSAANCTESAEYYYSCVCGAKGAETFSSVQATGHDWGEPEWIWADDYSSATAVFTCKNDASHTETMIAEIDDVNTEETNTEDGQTVYTASVTFNGQKYETQTVVRSETVGSDDTSGTGTTTGSGTSTGVDQADDGGDSGTGTTTGSGTSTGDDKADDSGDSDTSTGDTASAQTGDNSSIAPWIALMLAAGVGLTGTLLYSRKKKYSK